MKELRRRLAEIVQPDLNHDKFSIAYDWYMLAMIALSLVPLMVADEYTTGMLIIQWVTFAAFTIDFVIRCWVAPVTHKYRNKPFYNRYPFTFLGVVDFLSILPIISLFSYKLTLFRLFRLVRIAGLIKYTRYTDKDRVFVKVLRGQKDILLTILTFALLYIFVTALVMFNVEPLYADSQDATTFNTFFDALYWSTVTLTTVGYGDLCPVSVVGRTISMISSVFGIGIIATASSAITSGFMDELRNRNRQPKEWGRRKSSSRRRR